jgi:16S rRNA (uracil1498-N3)-methyltransferase
MKKKIHRFLVQSIPTEDTFSISDERVVHQAQAVLRLEPKEEIIVFTHEGDDVVCTIASIDKKSITLHKNRTVPVSNTNRKLIAAVSIIKGDRFELVVQKLTEIGVSVIVPIKSTRTVKQSVRLDRLQTISDEALEQCGGTRRVAISEPLELKECTLKFPFPSVVFAQDGTEMQPLTETTVMYVGPEGGWSEDDERVFKEIQAHRASLGNRILRTETAAIIGAYTILCL